MIVGDNVTAISRVLPEREAPQQPNKGSFSSARNNFPPLDFPTKFSFTTTKR